MDSSLSFKERLSLIFKEIKIGFSNGLVLGIISFAVTSLYIYFFKSQNLIFAFSTSGCVSLSLLCAMVIASFTGTAIPITLQKFGVDPAVASGPLISTVNDFVSVLIYYGLAWMLLLN